MAVNSNSVGGEAVLPIALGFAKSYTDQQVSKVRNKFQVVASVSDLPNPGDANTIYLVPTGINNIYDQYIYDTDTSSYVDIGNTTIDLDEYVTDAEMQGALSPIIDITGNFVVENGKLCIIVSDGNNNNANTNEALALDSTLQDLVDAVEDIADNVAEVSAASAAQAATDWMDEHLDPQTAPIVIDSSLTTQGAAADAKAAGDEISSLNSALTNMEDAIYETKEIETPYMADVDMLIETEVDPSGYVVSGTRNKGTLYPLKQGTFNVNGLKIVVDANKITIDGTTTSAMYFDFKTGEALPTGSASTEQLAGTEWSLPSRTWYISYGALTGYQNPVGLSFRKKDNSGSISLNYAPIAYDSSTMGGLCVYYSNGTEVHRGCHFNIVDSDTRDYASQKAERVEWITTNKRVEAKAGDYILADADSTVYGLYNRNIHKKSKFVYSNSAVPNSGSSIGIHVYVPMKEGYVDYIFVNSKRAVGTASHGACDVWRLNQVAKVNDLYIHQYYITALGETEMAIKVKYPVGEGESIPFIGGYAHGWETVNSGSFFAALNGKYVDITQYTSLAEFDTLEFFSTSTLYHPSTGYEIGQHGIKWTFTSEGLEIEQSISFSGNYTMIDSYMTMLCAVRDHFSTESVQVTDTYIDDLTFQQWDVSEPGFQTYPKTFKHGVSKVNLYGKTSGIDIAVEYVSQTHGNDGEGNYLWNGNDYNKIYNAIAGYNLIENQVTASTIWREHSKISIKAN